MSLEEQRVVIDADFFYNTTEYESGTGLFEKLMEENGYFPVMQKFVAEVELRGNLKLKQLLSRKIITVIGEKKYISQDDSDYNEYFHRAYEKINLYEIGDVDILKYGYDGQHAGESLGEIRSIYMAFALGYKIMLSEDGHSKLLANFVSSKRNQLIIETLYDLVIRNKKENGTLRWNDIKITIPKVYQKTKPNQYREIEELYQ